MVYVNDFRVAGPKANLLIVWDMIRKTVKMEPPGPFGLFLGCCPDGGSYHLEGYGGVRAISYNVEAYLKNSIDQYLGGAAFRILLEIRSHDKHNIVTPSNPTGVSHKCPLWHGTFAESAFLKNGENRRRH